VLSSSATITCPVKLDDFVCSKLIYFEAVSILTVIVCFTFCEALEEISMPLLASEKERLDASLTKNTPLLQVIVISRGFKN
jgi:hypothetical protein